MRYLIVSVQKILSFLRPMSYIEQDDYAAKQDQEHAWRLDTLGAEQSNGMELLSYICCIAQHVSSLCEVPTVLFLGGQDQAFRDSTWPNHVSSTVKQSCILRRWLKVVKWVHGRDWHCKRTLSLIFLVCVSFFLRARCMYLNDHKQTQSSNE